MFLGLLSDKKDLEVPTPAVRLKLWLWLGSRIPSSLQSVQSYKTHLLPAQVPLPHANIPEVAYVNQGWFAEAEEHFQGI